MFPEELELWLKDRGQPKYRALQIFRRLHSGVTDFDEFTDIPKSFREQLKEECYIADVKIVRRLRSQLDETVKYVYELCDGELIESVLMKYEHGYTVCISTQVGCRMGCSFCASGLGGLVRNLTASEMLSQLMAAERDNGIRVSNVVMMGMGEPLDNFDNTVQFLKLVSDDNGLNIGMRNISLSTCGIIPKIEELSELNLQITLSISLHAPNDLLRSKLMPINRKYGVDELLKMCKHYTDKTSRRISFEYISIKDVNDTAQCAHELSKKLKGMLCHVNIIPANEFGESGYKKSKPEQVERFKNILEQNGINVTVRRSLGSDIDASCGQLRLRRQKEM